MTQAKKIQEIEELKDPSVANEQLKTALDKFTHENDAESFLLTLRKLAKAQGGMSSLSKKVGINRQNLYRTFASTGNPKFRSLNSILKGLGYRLSIEPINGKKNDNSDNDNNL